MQDRGIISCKAVAHVSSYKRIVACSGCCGCDYDNYGKHETDAKKRGVGVATGKREQMAKARGHLGSLESSGCLGRDSRSDFHISLFILMQTLNRSQGDPFHSSILL